MGNKATEEIISTVRSIVGGEFADMDIIRALHLANNDPTAAINIIFDTPKSFRKPDFPKKSESTLNSEPPVVVDSIVKQNVSRLDHSDSAARPDVNLKSISGSNQCGGDGCTDSAKLEERGSEWWFVGSAEVTGLSTCKGRALKPGDEVNFTFPAQKKLITPSPGKIGGGRGRQVATCSEIIRFSTSACGEVMLSLLLKNILYYYKRDASI